MKIQNIIKEERKFRKDLLSLKPIDPMVCSWIPVFLNQSLLFELELSKYTRAKNTK
jgi:hypothetical protein